jgi:hypothetical protein
VEEKQISIENLTPLSNLNSSFKHSCGKLREGTMRWTNLFEKIEFQKNISNMRDPVLFMAEKVDQYEVVHLLLLDRAYNLCRILEL